MSALTDPAKDFPRWYQDVISKAQLAENGPVRGTMVIKPYGYSLWEAMQREIDQRIKATGAKNAYFPMLIPMDYLQKEAEHLEGFSPELAVVTQGGGKELEKPAAVRPTSETVINASFAKWVQSYRDLPLLINQWANVMRWELRPRLFLRTSEFLWQEGHTAHATKGEARDYAVRILRDVYEDFMVNVLAMPQLTGLKSPAETFPGAPTTLCCEAMMSDGKALQMATSHELGQNFSRMFSITYLDRNGEQEYVWQTSWGSSTRMVGGLIMAHGDEKGLVVPPRLAPTKVVVLVVRDPDVVGAEAESLCRKIRASLGEAEALDSKAGASHEAVVLDDNTDVSFGRRSTQWELQGIPLRVELGPRDLADGTAVLVRRAGQAGQDQDEQANPKTSLKTTVKLSELPSIIPATLTEQQQDMLEAGKKRLEERTHPAATIEEAVELAQDGFAQMSWDALRPQEEQLKEKAVTVRCLMRQDGSLPESAEEQDLVAVVGRSY